MKTDRAPQQKGSNPPAFLVTYLIGIVFIFVNFALSYGQSARLTLTLAPELQNAQILRVSDFNITGSGSVSRLFELVVTYSGAPTEFVFCFRLLSNGVPIVEANSRPIPVISGQPLTYQDFTRGGRINYNSEAVQNLTNSILQTGRLPDGTYVFEVTVSAPSQPCVPQGPQAIAQQILEISNPTTLDLISPGAPVGRNECPAVFGQLPQFKWDSNANRFLITICEVLPTNSSPEDVMQNQPRLRRILQRDVDFFGVPTFLYPPTELPLEPGKTYLWQIQALVDSPSGEVRLPGEIWCFRLNPLAGAGGEIEVRQLLNVLNSGEIAALFEEGGPLHGYTPTGRVRANGQQLTLLELLAQLRNQPIQIKSIEVE